MYSYNYRDNADDGLVCGILLLPMVAASKLMDLMKKNADQGYIGKIRKKEKEKDTCIDE